MTRIGIQGILDWSTPQPQNSHGHSAMKALNDGKVWDADQNGECHVCDNEEDDDESPMLMCSFCNVGSHNSKECLGSIGSVIEICSRCFERGRRVGLSHVLGGGAQDGER